MKPYVRAEFLQMTKKSLFLFLQPPPYPGYLNEHHEYKVCFGVRFLYRPGWLFTGPALCNWRFPARPEFIPSHKSFGSHPGVTVSAPTTTRRLPQKASILPPSVCDPFLATITPVVSHFLDALLFFAATPCLMLPSPHIWRLRLCRYFHGLPFTPRQTHTFICLFIHNFFACFNYDFFMKEYYFRYSYVAMKQDFQIRPPAAPLEGLESVHVRLSGQVKSSPASF